LEDGRWEMVRWEMVRWEMVRWSNLVILKGRYYGKDRKQSGEMDQEELDMK
jgi:hypothetical protein